MNRRSLLTSVVLALGTRRFPLACDSAFARSDERDWRHGVALFGDFKYPAEFKQFEYVNVGAPKGGMVRQIALGTYDNFNIVVDGVRGALAQGLDLNYDTLMMPALDEVSSEYGLLADSKTPPRSKNFVIEGPKRLLQQYLPESDICNATTEGRRS